MRSHFAGALRGCAAPRLTSGDLQTHRGAGDATCFSITIQSFLLVDGVQLSPSTSGNTGTYLPPNVASAHLLTGLYRRHGRDGVFYALASSGRCCPVKPLTPQRRVQVDSAIGLQPQGRSATFSNRLPTLATTRGHCLSFQVAAISSHKAHVLYLTELSLSQLYMAVQCPTRLPVTT